MHLTTSWPQDQGHSTRRPFGHARSFSSLSGTGPSNKPRTPARYPSISHLRSGSTASSRPSIDDEMSTLPDPRHRALSPDPESRTASPQHHPDLSEEVATLSTKLINAINHQTHLDDTLSATRHELEAAHETIRELEAQVTSQREILSGDVWIKRTTLDAERKTMQAEKKVLQAQATEELNKRLETEKEKKRIEQELENLTTALFEEANKMVVGAKEEAQAEQEILQRKIDQLKAQLVDSEALLQSQQEQLSELKHVMENMVEEQHIEHSNSTAPSSPGLSKQDSIDDERALPDGHNISGADAFTPSHPLSLQHLIQPVLRTDLSSYEDFVTLARVSRKRSSSRVSSGSIVGLNALALGLGGSTSSAHPSNASTTSLANSAQASGSAPQSPNTPASTVSTGSTQGPPLPALKETRFFKRVLAEDIEPTLRLDAAPGLSWLARRSVISAVSDGALVVEPLSTNSPYFAITKPQFSPCSLCGEARKDPQYLRNHRFRTSEAGSAQRYPLCKYCLTRVRSTCELLGFLRMVKDGHWRSEGDDLEKAAWEESVRLREQMFWSRIGGGVIPAGHMPAPFDIDKSPRASHEVSEPTEAEQAEKPVAVEAQMPSSAKALASEEADEEKSIGGAPVTEAPEDVTETKSARNSSQSLDTKTASGLETPKRLSITIPKSD
jgi:multidrug efflux pump subunit AcrA (membrane-fusion protein)